MRELLEKHKIELGLVIIGGVLVGLGVLVWKLDRSMNHDVVEIISQEWVAGEATESGRIVVDVAGEVVVPGVYELHPGDRIGEAIELAGGLGEKADKDWVSKYLNQAEKVKDGMKIFIPRVEELESGRLDVVKDTKSKTININSATEGELDTLPGIGPVTAKKIISNRPYGRKEELIEKKVVTSKVWEQIKELVDVW